MLTYADVCAINSRSVPEAICALVHWSEDDVHNLNAKGVEERISITPAPLGGGGKEVEAPPVFDLDIGRVAILMCFDINFPELWLHLSGRSVELVFWPSMYRASTLLSSLARVFHFHIVSAVRIHIDFEPPQFIDFVGNPIAADEISTSHARIFLVNVDLSKQIRHADLGPYEFKACIRSTPVYMDLKEGWYVWNEVDIVPRLEEEGKTVNDGASNHCAVVACDTHSHTHDTLSPHSHILYAKEKQRW